MRAFLTVPFALMAAACATPAPAPTPRAASKPVPAHAVNLYDDFGKSGPAEKDWGFATLIEWEGRTILFDSGRNADIFARNVAALGVDLAKVDLAILSHSHVDHTSGMDHLLKVNPRVPLYVPFDGDLGAPFMTARNDPGGEALPPELRYSTHQPAPSTGRFWKADVHFVEKSTELAPGLTLIATESPFMGWFDKYPPHEGEAELEGLPELSLALRTPKGDVLIVGCSHSGVERIVKEAKRVLGRPINLVMGGFHLLPYPEDRVRALALELREGLGVRRVAPAHCTGHVGLEVFREAFGERCLYAGLGGDVVF